MSGEVAGRLCDKSVWRIPGERLTIYLICDKRFYMAIQSAAEIVRV